jgi:hypothetical protein
MHRLEVVSIEGKGDLDTECVWLIAKENIERIELYIICDTTYTDDDHISNELRHMYWFPKRAVSRGDYIKLATKRGQNIVVDNKSNTKTHIFYWGLGHTVWNKDGDCAVLFKLEDWKTKRA